MSGIINGGLLGSVVSRLTYTYDPSNIRTSEVHSDGTVTTWSYDPSYRLTGEIRSGGPANTSFSITHSYDPAGNRTLQNDGTTVTTFSYSPANRLTLANSGAGGVTTYTYDASGNRTSELSPVPGESVFYAWDVSNRMLSAEVSAGLVTLTYNADGQRVVKESTDGSGTAYLYDHKRLLHETDEVGGDITNTFAAGTSEEFGDLIGEDGGLVHQYDAQADTNALLDPMGQVEAQYKYTAFREVNVVSIEGGAWRKEDQLS